MKRWHWILGGLLLCCNLPIIPHHRIAVGKLEPVEVIYFQRIGELCTVETDTGSLGQGDDFEVALENLKINALGEVFLDTVDNIIIQEDCEEHLTAVYKNFRPATRVYAAERVEDIEKTAIYLRTHIENVSISEYLSGEKTIPKIRMN